ncbi:MAG: nuclease [Gammaproteobacteria bacterium]|nr:MAG: nuclease [Gammaproteobacteria bacterium]TND03967.1 MAG: nuclease [Gammaproteobacteria bacterium]
MSPVVRHVRAPGTGALFVSRVLVRHFVLPVLLTVVWSAAGFAYSCPPDRIDETVQVAYVNDGDTVALADGRKLRIVGINTPELGFTGASPEAFATEARDALWALLASRREIGLRFDQQQKDRYGRVLAHVFLENGVSLTAQLLEQGYGSALTVLPNLWNAECYRAAEREARTRQRGIWVLPAYQHTDAAAVDLDASGYKILQGRVSRWVVRGGATYLYLDGKVVLRIHGDDAGYFDPRIFQRGSGYCQGRKIEVRGWLHRYKDHLYMRIRHPAALTILE